MSQTIKSLRANLNLPVHKASDSSKRDSDTSNPRTRITQLFDKRRIVTTNDSSTSFDTGSTVNSFSTKGPLKEEVAQRYRQILLKDYELRHMPPYLQRKKLPFQDGGLSSTAKPGIQDQKKISSEVNKSTEYVNRFKGEPLKENLLLDVEDEEDEHFPKIVNVFSLKSPSPTKKGIENHVTTKLSLTERGTTSVPKENGTSDKDRLTTTCSLACHVVTNQRGVQIPAEDISEQKDPFMKVKPHITSSDCVSLTRDEGIVTASFITGDMGLSFRTIGGGNECSKSAHAAVEQSVDDAEKNRGKNSASHKRSNDFGFEKQNKRSCKGDRTGAIFGGKELSHYQSTGGDTNYLGWDDLHQQQGCSDVDDELGIPKVQSVCSKESSKNVIDGRRKDLNNNARGKMCENSSSSNETSSNKSDNPSTSVAPYLPINSIRESKILDLKAQLAKQEEEILKLKWRKNVKKSDKEQSLHLSQRCSAAAETAFNFGDRRDCSEQCYRKFESRNDSKNHSEDDDASPPRTDEEFSLECDDLDGLDCSDAGRFEELKGIYRHVIKSFYILNARLEKSANGTREGYNGQQSQLVHQTKGWLVRHSIDKVELETAHVNDKDGFLSKLGLLRISSDSC